MSVPSLFFSFSSIEDLGKASGKQLWGGTEGENVRALASKGFPPVTSTRMLSLLTGYSGSFITLMRAEPSKFYRHFELKYGAKTRSIDAPRIAIKVLQSWLGHHISRAVNWPIFVHGYVQGRSIKSAAQIHVNSAWMLKCDVANFFGSTKHSQVIEVLSELGYSHPATALLADLFTLNGVLPQGAPSSPAIANLAFRPVDEVLAKIAKAYELRFSRYADDIVLSATCNRTQATSNEILLKVQEAIENHGWEINKTKTRIYQQPAPMRVLGLNVAGPTVRLSKRMRNKLRMIRFILERSGDAIVNQRPHFEGLLAFAKMFESLDCENENGVGLI